MQIESCWSCTLSLHEECYDLELIEEENYQCCCFGNTPAESVSMGREVGRPLSSPEDINDVLSAGRKRAAMLYPIYDGMTCEWSGLKNAGGGVVPIIGCNGNKLSSKKGGDGTLVQGDVHHGPDKNTLENGAGNAHRICAFCHHRWHAANDKFYGKRPTRDDGKIDGTKPFLPLDEYEWTKHDAETLATEEEIEENEIYWSTKNK
jgi:hypothetical protein